jgi:FdrA protein
VISTAVASKVAALVLPNTYRDSVELMRVAADLESRSGITRAGLVMATPANREVLRAADLLTGDALAAGPNDLVVAIAGDADSVEEALSQARGLLSGRGVAHHAEGLARVPPHTLAEALDEQPDAGLVLISTPGTYAYAEALKALKRGLDVFLFSDNVSVDAEIDLKRVAVHKGLLLMGPDCGTAILNGIPLGFANAVRPGRIGLIGASGTGLQQVACLIDAAGEGISDAIGVGGRDLDARVGGQMMQFALARMATDQRTDVIVLISKPPAPEIAERILAIARDCGKPVVINFLGAPATEPDGNLVFADTLEDAATAATALARGTPVGGSAPPLSDDLLATAAEHQARLGIANRRIVGLFSGGTLCKEASHLLEDIPHDLVDLGDDEFTVGRPHPMIDARLRSERIADVGSDPTAGVLLLDVVLGYGSHTDPAGALLDAIVSARASARDDGRHLAVVASVCGTSSDPQGLGDQVRKLESVGVLVAPSNAQAARLAAAIVGERA